jgi:hypothetical protein
MNGDVGLAVSPLDGSMAWFCAPAAAGTFTVWTTHDAGATWQQISSLSPAGPAGSWGCALTDAQSDPHTLAIMFSSGGGASGDLRSIAYLSTDAGGHWTRIPGLVGISQLDRAGSKLYAVIMDTAVDPAVQQTQIVMSADGMQTWTALRPSTTVEKDTFFRFWLDKTRGWLFAATYNGDWWQTIDGGATWTGLASIPASRPIQIDLGAWLPQQSQWDFCGWSGGPSGVQCSTDLGARWPAGPGFGTSTTCAQCANNVPPPDANNCYPSVLDANGALLAVCPIASSAPNATTFGVYRLPFGGSAWQRVALAPALLLTAPATGAVWYVGQGAVYTAVLPA